MMLAVDVDACRRWAGSWSDWSESLRSDLPGLTARLGDLELFLEQPTSSHSIRDASGELLRSALYLSLVATEVERADDASTTPDIAAITALAFAAHGSIPGRTGAAFDRTIDAHLLAADDQEQFEHDARTMTVAELNERMGAMPPDVLSVVMLSMGEARFANFVEVIGGAHFPSGSDQTGVLLGLGETISLDAWRRLGEHVAWIDPDPSTAISDSARDSPAAQEHFGRLRYQDFSGWSLFGARSDRPDPSQFRQGMIGDCYLIAGLITLGRQDAAALGDLVRPNANGTYTVTFADGSRQVVSPDLVVDPADPTEPVFATSDPGGALFPALVEKAWAQANGGYGEIVGGNSNAAIATLTGREPSWIDDRDIDIHDLAARFDAGENLGLSTIDRPPDVTADEWKADPDTPEAFTDSFGDTYARLHQNHAFVVADVDAMAGTVSVINPWDPSRPPFDLTADQLRESVNGVYVNAAP